MYDSINKHRQTWGGSVPTGDIGTVSGTG